MEEKPYISPDMATYLSNVYPIKPPTDRDADTPLTPWNIAFDAGVQFVVNQLIEISKQQEKEGYK